MFNKFRHCTAAVNFFQLISLKCTLVVTALLLVSCNSGTTGGNSSLKVANNAVKTSITASAPNPNVTQAPNTMKNSLLGSFQSGSPYLVKQFSVNNIEAVINGNQIVVAVPYGTHLDNLVASWQLGVANLQNNLGNGALQVMVDGVLQQNGVTINDFSHPVVYQILSGGKPVATYTATVLMEPGIVSFSIDNEVSTSISGQEITVKMPATTNLKNLVATFSTSDESSVVEINGVTQASGQSSNDFTNVVEYVVTNGGLKSVYTVKVKTFYFVAYYPAGCVVGDKSKPCSCIQDPKTGDVWLTTPVKNKDGNNAWNYWCTQNGGICPGGGELIAFNAQSHCGEKASTSFWHLPSGEKKADGNSSVQDGVGDWAELGKIAEDNGWTPNQGDSDLAVWMDENGFNDIKNNDNPYYLSSDLVNGDNNNSWMIGMQKGNNYFMHLNVNENSTSSILLVHDN